MNHDSFGAEFLETGVPVASGTFADASVSGYVYLAWLRLNPQNRLILYE